MIKLIQHAGDLIVDLPFSREVTQTMVCVFDALTGFPKSLTLKVPGKDLKELYGG
jgi:hypothetical protein